MESPFNLISSLYSKYQTHLLQKEYQLKKNIKFDLTLRHRTECFFQNPINSNILDNAKNHIVLPQWKLNLTPDFTLIGNYYNVKTINKAFINLSNLINNPSYFNPHSLIDRIFDFHEISHKTLNDFKIDI